MVLGIFIAAISFWDFSRLKGCDCIRPIYMLTLIATGIGAGIFIMALKEWIRTRNNDETTKP
jgi:prepilin signal peptidase PulO-like enzyme (type II secretory pathway)